MLDDLTTLVTEIGDKLDVIMVPKVQGAEDIHYVDRILAQLEAKAGLEKPLLVHAILETARGVANVEEICGASPRMQGLSLGPADLAADRRMKTTRVGGGHPGYLVRQDPPNGDIEGSRTTYQQDLWHYTIARMVDACAMHGIYPYYGPFGDIADVVACEDQFRNAFLLGCVGAWSLHPKQIAIANKVFSPSVEDVKHARRVIAAMGDGTGAVMLDGKMEDDASVKQCQVMVALAEELAAIDPELKQAVRRDRGRRVSRDFRARRSVLYMPSSNERALEKAKTIPCDGLILDLEDAVAPDAKADARDKPAPPPPRASTAARGDHPGQRRRHRVARRRPRAAARPAPTRSSSPRSTARDAVLEIVEAMAGHGAPRPHEALGDGRDAVAMLHAEEIAVGLRPARRARHGHQRPRQGAARRARARPPAAAHRPRPRLLAARATGKVILDGVYNDVKDLDGFEAECRQGRQMGFDGKTLIHPSQVDGANEAFAPATRRRGRPRHLQPWRTAAGKGVVTYNGRMVENLHVESAQRTLSIHEAIQALHG